MSLGSTLSVETRKTPSRSGHHERGIPHRRPSTPVLSPTLVKVARYIVAGKSAAEIAAALNVKRVTAAKYVSLAIEQTESGCREGLAAWARREFHIPDTVSHVPLLPSELQLVALIRAGKSNLEIAEKLKVSEGTIRVRCSSIMRRAGFSKRVQLGGVIFPASHKDPVPNMSVVIAWCQSEESSFRSLAKVYPKERRD